MADFKMHLPDDVEYIISKLNEKGYRADVVGGAVRDAVLGMTAGDYDITTSAMPEEIKAVFSEEKTVDTGIKHGTVTLVLNHNPYEITTYRIDGDYLDSRHPESVSFTRNIKDDLGRRDFTVNAMAYNTQDGLVDLFGGIDDAKARVIRAVGNPETRFCEDALRILRALRFSSKLRFEIEKETERAIFSCSELLKRVSVERIYSEWMKLLAGAGAYSVLEKYRSVVELFLPELAGADLPDKDCFEKAKADFRFISLFESVGAESFCSAIERMHADNRIKQKGRLVLENYKSDLSSPVKLKLLLSRVGKENAEYLLDFRSVFGLSSPGERESFKKIIENGECYEISSLKINGSDLKQLGFSGKAIGEKLALLLSEVISGRLENKKDELLEAVSHGEKRIK